jgi:hypothetical protein
MTYSCSDFTDDILDKLGIVVPEADRDNPAAQAGLALAEIIRLQAIVYPGKPPRPHPADMERDMLTGTGRGTRKDSTTYRCSPDAV